MTMTTEAAPVMTEGATDDELAVMREAAAVFARRFAGAVPAGDDPFGALARSRESAPRWRTSYDRVGGYHWCV
jgi:hypothetical protein